MFKIVKYVVGGAVVLGVLSACSHDAATVNGTQDDTRFLPEIAHTAWHDVPIKSRQCVSRTRTVTSTVNGKTTTKQIPYQDCKNVTTGHRHESYRAVTRYAQWCVELDNVNGKSADDDRWFTVTSPVYYAAVKRNEGDKVTKMPYLHRGC